MEGTDPYLAPASTLIGTTSGPARGPVASKLRRFFNWLIDRVVIYGVTLCLFLVTAFIGGDPAIAWMDALSWGLDTLIGFAILVIYYTLLEGLFGFTVGKLITDTRVVDEHGWRVGFGRAALRSLCRLIPFDAFSLLLSDDTVNRGWHDTLPRTYVVRRRPVAANPDVMPAQATAAE